MKLKTWRIDTGTLQADLAAKLGLSASALSALERGETWPDPDLIDRIALLSEGQVIESDHKEVWYTFHPERRL